MKDTKFWVEEPCVLLSQPSLFPSSDMSKTEKLNALTRLVVIITIIMYFMKYEHWSLFLILGVVILIILNYCNGDKSEEVSREDFTIVPTYTGTDFQQTIVSPTYAEEWQVPPPAYDLYTSVPSGADTFDQPLQPQSYPYGQYLTRTNLLPSDEYYSHLGCGGPRTARNYINSTYLRNSLAFRENMTRLYKKKLNRRFRHNGCNDTYSPFSSY
jgi:hypothetical protein